MNLTKLFETQRLLDAEIERKHPRVYDEDRMEKRVLALCVELSELANELPEVFKFWSNKKNNYEKALMEFVDCIHFALSIGLQHNIPLNLDWQPYRKNTLAEQFKDLIQADWEMYYPNVYHGYCRNMELLIGLGEMLGFTWEQVEVAYMSKNDTNWERQANGY